MIWPNLTSLTGQDVGPISAYSSYMLKLEKMEKAFIFQPIMIYHLIENQ